MYNNIIEGPHRSDVEDLVIKLTYLNNAVVLLATVIFM